MQELADQIDEAIDDMGYEAFSAEWEQVLCGEVNTLRLKLDLIESKARADAWDTADWSRP